MHVFLAKMNAALPVGRHGEAGYMFLLGPRKAKAEQCQDNGLSLCLCAGRWNKNHGFQSCFRFSPEGAGFYMVIICFFWVVRRALPYFTACFVAIELVVRRAVFNWIFPVG